MSRYSIISSPPLKCRCSSLSKPSTTVSGPTDGLSRKYCLFDCSLHGRTRIAAFWEEAPFRSWVTLKSHKNNEAANSFHHGRSEEHTSELQSLRHLVCRLLLEKK